MRGNPQYCPEVGPLCGSIPACAGEPTGSGTLATGDTVYPRVCGGTDGDEDDDEQADGLSPRVRGNPSATPPTFTLKGSIPACAGEPGGAMVASVMLRVYPRVCGGTVNTLLRAIFGEGLSPRVRGNHRRDWLRSDERRSIPACAGEPAEPGHRLSSLMVYPRVCGGTIAACITSVVPAGLSPRVRGNRGTVIAARDKPRSIPACAGEPRGASHRGGRCPVYPRVCGGTLSYARRRFEAAGLSPRVRGNLPRISGFEK